MPVKPKHMSASELKELLSGIGREQIILAAQAYDRGNAPQINPRFDDSHDWDLLIRGTRYAIRRTVAIAHKMINSESKLTPYHFGSENDKRCRKWFVENEFEVVPKSTQQ